MSDIAYQIGAFDAAARAVTVAFVAGAVEHTRTVNACLGPDGGYDAEATAARVEAVGAGVAAKIAAGAITSDATDVPAPAPQPQPQPQPEPEPDPAAEAATTPQPAPRKRRSARNAAAA